MKKVIQENQLKERDLSHAMVHYLLTVHKLKEKKGYARVTDIAKDLDLTKGSVSTALNNLKKKKLVVEEEESKFLVLTHEGHKIVHNVLSSRTLLFYFLRDFVGVNEKIAEKDSCSMEHLLSRETSEKFFRFLKELVNVFEGIEKEGKSTGKLKLKSSLKFCDYKNVDDFFADQVGDRYLLPDDK